MSQSVFRGMVAPLGVIVFGFITLLLFVQARVSGSARPSGAALLDAETQVLMRQRASRIAERNRADARQQGADEDAGDRPSGNST